MGDEEFVQYCNPLLLYIIIMHKYSTSLLCLRGWVGVGGVIHRPINARGVKVNLSFRISL